MDYARGLANLPLSRLPEDIGARLVRLIRPNSTDECGAAMNVLIRLPQTRMPDGIARILQDNTLATGLKEDCQSFIVAGIGRLPVGSRPSDVGEMLFAIVGDDSRNWATRTAAARALSRLPDAEIPSGTGGKFLSLIQNEKTDVSIRYQNRTGTNRSARLKMAGKWYQRFVRNDGA